MCKASVSFTESNVRVTASKLVERESKLGETPPPIHHCEASSSDTLRFKDHFSSLLFGGSIVNTLLEFALLLAPYAAMALVKDPSVLNAPSSMPFEEVARFFVICAIVRRVYNAYLEAVSFSFTKLRTQPPIDHLLKQKKDLMGRDYEQLKRLHFHDQLTMISQFLLNFSLYYMLPGIIYPAAAPAGQEQSLQERFLRLVANHYILSFGMYWAHRSLHVIPFLWEHIHSFHHYAKHPLSRNTNEDHWADNFANAVVGHVFAQILLPLDRPTFWFSRIFRILESLEKHSGVSCKFNIAHSVQQWMPFAQMPHHHDWHHEGFKGSNYTFSSLGGIWDCIFGTRKGGRYTANKCAAATREDLCKTKIGFDLPAWFSPLYPLGGLTILVAMKLGGSF
jgi:sterol desaturase/sphingolipid hydroxylase (fatty acid hydroxylase superfamily)